MERQSGPHSADPHVWGWRESMFANLILNLSLRPPGDSTGQIFFFSINIVGNVRDALAGSHGNAPLESPWERCDSEHAALTGASIWKPPFSWVPLRELVRFHTASLISFPVFSSSSEVVGAGNPSLLMYLGLSRLVAEKHAIKGRRSLKPGVPHIPHRHEYARTWCLSR